MAELIDKRTTRKTIEKYFESLAPSHYYKMDLKKASVYLDAEIAELPTTTEAEIRATAEHTYENCHNITCRRKCRKDGYNMAIDEFAEKLKVKFVDFKKSTDIITLGTCIRLINSVAEQLKEE